MVPYDVDPDVVRWGLHLLYGDAPNMTYGFRPGQSDYSHDHDDTDREPPPISETNNVENDEIIAYTLQQDEFAEEASALSYPSEKQKSLPLGDGIGSTERHGGTDANNEEHDASSHESEAEVSTSCSTPDRSQDGAENASTFLELADDSSPLDGEVRKRLSTMSPIPHVPRTNRDRLTEDEEVSDHQRLLDRLKLYGLSENQMIGDGNCQFRALSDQFYRTPEHYEFVRSEVVKQLKECPEMYREYVTMEYDEYLNKVAENHTWGDHVTLQAFADLYGLKIWVVTSYKDTCFIEILPKVQRSRRVLFLSFWAEIHYNSIYPEGEVPSCEETRKKKSWWKFASRS